VRAGSVDGASPHQSSLQPDPGFPRRGHPMAVSGVPSARGRSYLEPSMVVAGYKPRSRWPAPGDSTALVAPTGIDARIRRPR